MRLHPGLAVILTLSALISPACKKYSEDTSRVGRRAIRAISDARRLAIESDLKTIAYALQQYMMEQGELPQGSLEDVMKVLVPTYMRAPMTTSQGFPIRYRRTATGFELAVWGPDERWDTRDDIKVTGP